MACELDHAPHPCFDLARGDASTRCAELLRLLRVARRPKTRPAEARHALCAIVVFGQGVSTLSQSDAARILPHDIRSIGPVLGALFDLSDGLLSARQLDTAAIFQDFLLRISHYMLDYAQPLTLRELREDIAARSAFDRLDEALGGLADILPCSMGATAARLIHCVARWYKAHAMAMPAALRELAADMFSDLSSFDVAAQSDVALACSVGSHMLLCTGRCHGRLDQRLGSSLMPGRSALAATCAELVEVDSVMLRLHLDRDWQETPELAASWASTAWRCLAAGLIITCQSRLAVDSGFLVRVIRLLRRQRQRDDIETWRLEPHLATLILGVIRSVRLDASELVDMVDEHGLLESLAISMSTASSLRQGRSPVFRALHTTRARSDLAGFDMEWLVAHPHVGLAAPASWPPSARERIGGLLATVAARVGEATAAAGPNEHPTVARTGRAVVEWWIALARSFNVAAEDPPSPCSGPSCIAESATSSCARCRFTRYCGPRCQRASWPIHRLQCDFLRGADSS